MPTYLEIAVNVPQVVGVFHYHLTPELEGKVVPGHLVEVPFGRQVVQGVVIRRIERPDIQETRAVLKLIDPGLVLTPAQVDLAIEMSKATLASLASCIALMLPPGLSQKADTEYQIAQTIAYNHLPQLDSLEKKLLAVVNKRGALRGRQIDQSIKNANWRPAANRLVRKGLLSAHSVLPPPNVHPKYVRTVQLACAPEQAQAAMSRLGRPGTEALRRRQAVMKFLLDEPDPVDVAWVYAESGGNQSDLHYLAEHELVILGEGETWRDPVARLDFVPADPPALTIEQEAILAELVNGLECAASGKAISPYLLHGVTGSGKTEIYLRAAAEAIRLGKQAIILVPEIALTPQTIHRFVSRFPGRVGLVHSQLSQGERYDTWRRARLGLISLVVGPRSALFTPFPNLGLIVLDECHDDSYYQAEQAPNYHALDTAVTYARRVNAVCLLGSATPDITSRYHVQQNSWHYLHLPNRILAHRQVIQSQTSRLGLTSHYHPLSGQAESIDLPPVEIVDMRQELKDGNRSIFSRSLQATLARVLEHHEQAILFLNRRGTATYVFCRNCGFSLQCPHCEIPLIYHSERSYVGMLESLSQKLVCHHCNYQRSLPKTCPQCGSNQIRQLGTGTESIETDVQNQFPGVRTLRWDYETTRKKDSHEMILSHFANHRADVLVGTQMVAKGLDLPLVTLVGIVLADVGLNLPDYRATERTFQLLTQVAGRAGRSPLGGRVILQTFQPENYVIQAAALHDYETFYRQELNYRKQLGYPPYSKLVRLEYRHSQAEQAESQAMALAAQIRSWITAGDRRATDMIGPAPCFFTRLGGLYRWQIILRGPNPVSLLAGRFLGDWHIEVDPVSLL